MTEIAASSPPTSVPELIDALGPSWLSRQFGHKNASTVSGWKSRSTIPPEYWMMVIAAAEEKSVPGVSNDTLAHWHAKAANLLPVAEDAALAEGGLF